MSYTASRRSVMTALALSPVIIGASAFADDHSGEFERRLAEYRRVRQAFASHPAAKTPYNDPRIKELEREQAALSNAVDEAMNGLICYPARNSADAATKIEILISEYEGSVFEVEQLQPILEDLRRLAA